MPKLKTNKAAKKRMRITRKGKAIASHTLKRHMLTDRTPKKKRQARQSKRLTKKEAQKAIAMLPYDH